MILAMLTHRYRGRFAPSPTGALHAGSLATALGSWLCARVNQGTWLIRIEDVDTTRTVAGATEHILHQLSRCGLNSDEPVIYQSKRGVHYQSALNELRNRDKAYACRCTRRQIELALEEKGFQRQRHQELPYPGTCRDRTDVCEPCAWRLKVDDASIFSEVGDFVLRRADGIYAYQLAVVVDDHLQSITHVVRGSDLEDNTPRQNYLQQQMDYSIPKYNHLPLVNNQDGEKLSKQSGALPIDVKTDTDVLQALRDAALHLSLTDARLYSKATSISNWLEIALESAKLDAQEKRILWLQF